MPFLSFFLNKAFIPSYRRGAQSQSLLAQQFSAQHWEDNGKCFHRFYQVPEKAFVLQSSADWGVRARTDFSGRLFVLSKQGVSLVQEETSHRNQMPTSVRVTAWATEIWIHRLSFVICVTLGHPLSQFSCPQFPSCGVWKAERNRWDRASFN